MASVELNSELDISLELLQSTLIPIEHPKPDCLPPHVSNGHTSPKKLAHR